MIVSAIPTIEKSTENQQIKIYRADVKKSFGQIPNWLLFKIAQRLPAKEHHAWCLLAYLISTDPNNVITPQILSEKTGHCLRSIYTYMGYLIGVGHIRSIKIRGIDARFITTIYEVYQNKYSWHNTNTNLQKGDIVENNCQNKAENDIDTNMDLQKGENKEKNKSSYYKNTPRARARNTENNTVNPTDCYSIERKNNRPNRRKFFAAVPIKLRNKETPKLINSLIKYFEDEAFDFMSWVFCNDSILDPIGYMWGAVNKKKADSKARQSLTQPQSVQNLPSNPRKADGNKDQEKSKNYNSNESLKKNTNKIIVFKDKKYIVGEAGEVQTESGCFNKYQVERLVQKGVMWFDQ